MVCSKCQQVLNKPCEIVKCSHCSAEFHPACCRVRTVAKLNAMTASGTTWRCEDCKSDTEDSAVLELLKSMQLQLSENSKQSQTNFAALEISIASVQTSLDGVREKLASVEKENVQLKEECTKLMEANDKLSKRVWDIQGSVMDLEQHSRLQNLEVRGIPVTEGEDVYAVLKEVSRALDLPYSRSGISVAHRLPTPKKNKFPPTIIVQFVSRSTRAEWLAAAKLKRLQTTDLLPTFNPAPVFVNEHLTRHNKELLVGAKALVKSGRLAFAWAKEGKVYVRTSVGSKARRIFWDLRELTEEDGKSPRDEEKSPRDEEKPATETPAPT